MEAEKKCACGALLVGDTHETQDGVVCNNCFENDYSRCNDCGEYAHNDDVTNINDGDYYVCQNCYDSNYFCCDGCGLYLSEDVYDQDGLCRRCVEREEEFDIVDRGDEIQYRRSDTRTDKHQSKEVGDIIKSSRKFGLEFEMVNDEIENLNKLSRNIDETHGVGRDGSIRGGYGIEIQTPILQGKSGERAVAETLKVVKGYGFKVNKTCGTHCHLDAKDFVPEYKEIYYSCSLYNLAIGDFAHTMVKKPVAVVLDANSRFLNEVNNYIRTSYVYGIEGQKYDKEYEEIDKVKIEVEKETGKVSVTGTRSDAHKVLFEKLLQDYVSVGLVENNDGNIVGLYSIKNSLLKNKTLCIVDGGNLDRLSRYLRDGNFDPRYLDGMVILLSGQAPQNNTVEKLKKLLAFYTVFDDVILAMLAPSRRVNEFCAPVKNRYNIADIMTIRNQDDFDRLWYRYRGRRGTNGGMDREEIKDRKRDHHDSTRYVGVNIHSLFEETGTIEIRYHSGTLDAGKILNWVALHQTILDTISTNKVSLTEIIKCNAKIRLESKVKDFCEMLGLSEAQRDYVNGRIKTYNK